MSALNIASIIFVLCAGFPQAQPANLTPFTPYGADGVFAGASVVFFAFVGFDYGAPGREGGDPARAANVNRHRHLLPRPTHPPVNLPLPPAVANAAEEAKDPARDLPWGIVGSLGIATVL